MNEEMDNLKQTILDNYPRLATNDVFQFACHPGVPCFNDCCGDVNIFLTPYDIIRLKSHLKISSGEFLQKYTISPFDKKQKFPVRETQRIKRSFMSVYGQRLHSLPRVQR